jgi:hypothetical protein
LTGLLTTDELESVSKRVDRFSTESFAIVHELDTHSSLINETVWELRASVEATVLRETRRSPLSSVLVQIFPARCGGTCKLEIKWTMPFER